MAKAAEAAKTEHNFVVSSFSAVWWVEIVEKPSSRPNHLWFRLTLTVKLDHHQWTHVTRWQKEMRWKIVGFRWDANRGKAAKKVDGNQTVLNFYNRIVREIKLKVLLTLFSNLRSVNCWGNGQSYCYSLIVSIRAGKFIFEASGMRSWRELIGIQAAWLQLPRFPPPTLNFNSANKLC